MIRLRLRLNMYGDERLGTAFIIANVLPLDRSVPQDLRRRLRNLEIPADDEYEVWKEVDIPPGRYEIQIALPSGEFRSRDIRIDSNSPNPFDVAFEAESPHEWLFAQYLQGNVGSGDRSRSPWNWTLRSIERGAVDLPWSETARLYRRLDAADRQGTSTGVNVFWCVDSKPPEMAGRTWALVNSIIRAKRPPDQAADQFWSELPATGPRQAFLPARRDDDARAWAFRFKLDGPVSRSDEGLGRRQTGNGGHSLRRYILVQDDEMTRLVCAAVPWYDLDSGEDREVAFEILSPLGSASVTTAIRETRFASIIGYLTNNSLRAARLLVDRAQEMLFHKFTNPLGAAAGAYVMLATENERQTSAWHRWVENLYRHFPWIPDGAVIYATMKLNHQETDGDVDEALNALLTAYERGIPFYSLGMRWLLDGLTTFSEDESYAHRRDEILSRLRHVQVIARWTNYQQPFTSIQLSCPSCQERPNVPH